MTVFFFSRCFFLFLRSVSFRSGQPPPLVPRTKFLSFSVDLCIFIFRRHPSFFFLLLSLFSTLTPASPYSSSLRHGDFLPLNKHLDDCFTFRAEDLSSSLSRTTPTIQIWPSCRSTTTTTTTMYSCSNYPRGCRGRCNIQGGKCSDCTVGLFSKQLPAHLYLTSSTVTQPTTTAHNGIPVCSEPGRIPPPRSDDHLRPARSPRQVQPGVNRPKISPQNSTSMHYQ